VRRLFAAASVALLVLLTGCTGKPAPVATSAFALTTYAPAERKPAPAISAELLDGSGTYTLPGGVVTVINFWASWCGPCVAEASELEQAYQATKGDGVTFLGVNTRGDDRDAAKQFVAKHKTTYPNVFDPTGRLSLGLPNPPPSVPATIVLDRQGRVAAVAFGPVIARTLEPVLTDLSAEAA
jgi:thiol-disulfide isomerase/thioredoxin